VFAYWDKSTSAFYKLSFVRRIKTVQCEDEMTATPSVGNKVTRELGGKLPLRDKVSCYRQCNFLSESAIPHHFVTTP